MVRLVVFAVLMFFAVVAQCCAQTYDRFAERYDPLGINERPPDTAPLLTIYTEALQSLEASRRRQVVVFVATTFYCGPCEWMKTHAGSGDDEVEIVYLPESEAGKYRPGWKPTAFPTVYFPDADVGDSRAMDLATVKDLLAKNPPKNAPRAVTIGTVKGREAIAKLLDSLSHQNGTATVELGSASVVLPEQLTSTLALSRDAASVSFPGVKPRVKVGTGWLSVAREVAGFKTDRATGLLTISVVSFPDLVFTLE